MIRYIDADKLVEMYERAVNDEWNKKTAPSSWSDAYDCVIADIDDVPTADVVEVVRCKDCKHYGGVTYGFVCRKYSGADTKVCTEKDHYCSYGERREENEG